MCSTNILKRRLTKPKAENHCPSLPVLLITLCIWTTTVSPVPITNTNYFSIERLRSLSEVTHPQPPYPDWSPVWQTTKPTLRFQPRDIVISKDKLFKSAINTRKDDLAGWNWDKDHRLGTDNVDMTTSVVEVLVYIVIVLVILSFVSFVVCICCPICVFAKIGQRRRGLRYVYTRHRGVSIAGAPSPPNINPAAPVSAAAASQVIAVPNPTSNAPYPVQETVTVIPVVSPQGVPNNPINCSEVRNFGTKPPPYLPGDNCITPISANELPPPYPGLPTSLEPNMQQQPYNPYFPEQNGPPPQSPTQQYNNK